MPRVPGRSGRLSGQAIDEGLETIRLTVLAFVVIDLVSTLTALSYGRPDFGPSGPVAAVQMILVTAAAVATMWRRTRAALALTALVVILEFSVAPSGMEPWLVLITGVTIAARARLPILGLGALAHLGYGLGFGLTVERRYRDAGLETGLLTVAFSAVAFGVGLLARLLLGVRDRWWSTVRELERENADIRAVERRRLADDLQTAVTRGLNEISDVIDGARRSSSAAVLSGGLAQVDALSRSLLGELRVLLEVLRSECGSDQRVTVSGWGAGGQRWLTALTARPVRFAVVAVVALSALRVLIGHLTGVPGLPAGYADVLPAVLLCVVTGLRFGPGGWWVVVLGLAAYGGALTVWSSGDPVNQLIVLGYAGGMAWVGGQVARHFLLARSDSRRRVVHLMEERPRVEEQEREALARELHDVVAHQLSLSTMAVLATSWSDDPETLRGTLDRVQRHTEAASGELDTLLTTMRGPWRDGTRSDPAMPNHGATATTNVDLLAKQLADHGLTPVMDVAPAVDALDDTTQRTVGRILQEGATNVLRYAPPGSRCHFVVTLDEDLVRLTITSALTPGGRGVDSMPSRRSDLSLGYGLRGIRERVELVHGTFRAGPEERSWVVAVTLPVRLFGDAPWPAPVRRPDHAEALPTGSVAVRFRS